MARHAPGHRVDGVFHGDAFFGELGGQFLDRVLGTGDGQTIAGHDDHGFGVAKHKGGIVGAAALDRALHGRARSCGGRGIAAEAAQDHIEERAVHRLAHDVAQDRAADEPTSEPAMISIELFSEKPMPAAAQPE